MTTGDNPRLERQGDALILHLRGASWVAALLTSGFALIWLYQSYSAMMANQSERAFLGHLISVVIGVMIGGWGVFLWLPREVVTTFDLRSQRVLHHVNIGRGRYERRRIYAFAEILGLGLEYDAESGHMLVMALRDGRGGGSAPKAAAI